MSLDRAPPQRKLLGARLCWTRRQAEALLPSAAGAQERLIGIAQFRFGAFLFADVRGGDHRECSPFRVVYLAGCDDTVNVPAGLWNIKFVARAALLFSLSD